MENGNENVAVTSSLDSLFDMEALRLAPDYAAMAAATKVLTTVPVRRPDPQVFIRVRPAEAYQLTTMVLEMKEDREVYLVHPTLREALSSELTIKHFYTVMSRQGTLSLWAIRMPGPDGRLDTWNQSAHKAAELAMKQWIRVQANRQLAAYDVYAAAGEVPEPEWPECSMQELLKIAFKDRYVTNLEHPIIQQLQGR